MNPFRQLEQRDGVAVVTSDGISMTYRSVASEADGMTCELKPGDLAGIECDNSLGSFLAYIGAMRKQVPVMLLDSLLPESKRNALYERFRVSIVYSPSISKWARRSDSGPCMSSELALLLSTSGTTGSPKMVRLSHANIASNARQIASYLRLTELSSAITLLPQHYSFGLSIINSHLVAGGRLVLTNASVVERRFWDQVRNACVESISGVPRTFEQFDGLRFDRMELPSLRTLTQAGGRLKESLVEKFGELCERRGWKFYVMYGQTEATARMSFLSPELYRSKPSSIGKAIPLGRFELVDEQKNTITKPNSIGELVYHGPNVMLGYAESADDLQLGDEQFGRLETGDLAEFDEEGFFYIKGRTKRFLKIFGNRIGLDDVEKLVTGTDRDIVVGGRDDMLLLAGQDEERLLRAVDAVSNSFNIHRSAIRTLLVKKFPFSSSGKLLYTELLRLFDSVSIANE